MKNKHDEFFSARCMLRWAIEYADWNTTLSAIEPIGLA